MAKELNNLKCNSVNVYDGMEVIFHQKTDYLDLGDIPIHGRHYAATSSIILFCDEGVGYVTPFNKGAKALLESEGFKERDLYVPFSRWEYPKDEMLHHKWDSLRVANYRTLAEEFREDCEEYCNVKGIAKPLPNEVLAHCYNVPKDGVKIRWYGDDVTLYPAISGIFMDPVIKTRLGIFANRNGKVAFVYRDSKTFIAKGYWIIPYLRQAGYVPGSLAVAFTNGEEIIDPVQKKIWDAVPDLDVFEL